MQYTCLTFSHPHAGTYKEDLFLQALADAGFESFEESTTPPGTLAYVQTSQLSREALLAVLESWPEVHLVSSEACEERNWNELWEAEHPVENLPMGVKITPHCAFGAGHHETTGMMIDALMALPAMPERVLDQGTGTGVLGIFAKKLGAKDVVAVDIDDRSVINALENAADNDVVMDVRLSGEVPAESFGLILANIHRNILLTQLPDYARCLSSGGMLWLSGFYEADIHPLLETAESLGLALQQVHERGEWRMLQLLKK